MREDSRADSKIDSAAASSVKPAGHLLAAAFDAMAIFAANAPRLLAANRAFARMFAIDLADAIGRPLGELGIAAGGQAERLAERLAAGATIAAARAALRTRDGRPVSALIAARQIEFDGGEAVAVTFRDAGRRRAERALMRAVAAREAGRLKTAFLANLNHEIRTPLNVIMGYGEALAEHFEETGDAGQSAALAALQRAGRRLAETIDEILEYARLDAGAIELRPTPIELGPLLAAACDASRAAAEAHGLAFALENAAPDAIVRCDRFCLEAALAAVLRNAIKFTERGGITVRLARDAAGVLELTIADTGVGIGGHYLERLFEPFSQEQETAARRFEGLGLGLARAYRLLALNGGRLAVASLKGHGATVTIRFDHAGAPPAPW